MTKSVRDTNIWGWFYCSVVRVMSRLCWTCVCMSLSLISVCFYRSLYICHTETIKVSVVTYLTVCLQLKLYKCEEDHWVHAYKNTFSRYSSKHFFFSLQMKVKAVVLSFHSVSVCYICVCRPVVFRIQETLQTHTCSRLHHSTQIPSKAHHNPSYTYDPEGTQSLFILHQ